MSFPVPALDPALAATRRAAADVVRIHQRRHVAGQRCCCGWSPGPGDLGWAHHVAEQLEHARLLVTPTTASTTTTPGDPSA